MNTVIFAIVYVTTIGIISAVILSVVSKLLQTKSNESLVQLQEVLPGLNCGACGYPGCLVYAMALLSEENVKSNLCFPGGAEVAAKISAILGIDAGSIEQKAAIVHCQGFRLKGGSSAQQDKMEYFGLQSCEAAKQLFGGEGSCAFGCLGFGDCQKACPSNAICIENSLAYVMKKFCTGCGLCVKACPNNLISVENRDIAVSVLCKSIEKGAIKRKKCLRGCIACGKCVRECPANAIVIEDNLAIIDHDKCGGCGHCAEVCITKSIQQMNSVR